MNILDKIIAHKKREVAEQMNQVPVRVLEQSVFFERKVFSFSKHLKAKEATGIIAEFKRQSPSKGIINANATVEEVSTGYIAAGASALSILTDESFFGGTNVDLLTAREVNSCPILRKDFTVNEYQIIEAKSIGADVILLIAAALSKTEVKELSTFAISLGLEVLLEINCEAELGHITDGIGAVGINNRNLADFTVDVNRSFELGALLPKELLKISESGLNNPAIIAELKKAGFDGFLIGENFMKTENPGSACKSFINTLNELYSAS